MANTVSPRLDGKFEPAYSDQEFLEAIQTLGGSAETSAIVSEVGCSHKTASTRLKELAKGGRIHKEEIGNSNQWKLESDTVSDCCLSFLSDYLSGDSRLKMDADLGMVITIRRQHSQAILSGKKDIEFRRTNIDDSKSPSMGFIYEPKPTKSIVGIFQIESIQIMPVEHLCEIGPQRTPSTQQSLKEYFEGKDRGAAIYIKDSITISPPIPLRKGEDGNWIFNPPQDFYYVDPFKFLNKLRQGYLNSERPGGESHELGDFVSTS